MQDMKILKFHRKPMLALFLIVTFVMVWMVYKLPGKSRQKYKGKTSLVPAGDEFYLNGKPFRILSGAMHYFRIVPEYWEDRLKKLRAMGLNTVEIYVPWNLHEENESVFNFNDGLDIKKFIKLAYQLGLYVIVRPGPYICAEWDLGGLPSWLLQEEHPQLRTSDKAFLEAVESYFDQLLPMLVPLQYVNGGPIIAFQIENEYGSFPYGTFKSRSRYMEQIQKIMVKNGLTELLFTSDGIKKIANYELKEVFKTVNFQNNATSVLKKLKKIQPDKPLMVTEYWSGWFDHWGEKHHTLSVEQVVKTVSEILDAGASINFYMFHGGTNFGFMNGANFKENGGKYLPTITSYDYDAPLTESGDVTEKFYKLQKVIREHAPSSSVNKNIGKLPETIEKAAYESMEFQQYLPLNKMVTLLEHQAIKTTSVMPMEQVPHGGQKFGFILYRALLPSQTSKVAISKIRDRAQVFLDFKEIKTIDAINIEEAYIDYNFLNKQHVLNLQPNSEFATDRTLDILVENLGRVNFLTEINNQRKGILGDVLVDDKRHSSWEIYSLDFNFNQLERFQNHEEWQENTETSESHGTRGPALYKGTFIINDKPKDTFISMKGWSKGVCFINGHNLGRYWHIGPQETLYVPAPFLSQGKNEVLVFELHRPNESHDASFAEKPQLAINEAIA